MRAAFHIADEAVRAPTFASNTRSTRNPLTSRLRFDVINNSFFIVLVEVLGTNS